MLFQRPVRHKGTRAQRDKDIFTTLGPFAPWSLCVEERFSYTLLAVELHAERDDAAAKLVIRPRPKVRFGGRAAAVAYVGRFQCASW